MFYFIKKQNKTVFFQNVNVIKDEECSRSMETRLVMTQYGAWFGTGTGSKPEWGRCCGRASGCRPPCLRLDGGLCLRLGALPTCPPRAPGPSSHCPQLWLLRVGTFLLVFPRQVVGCLSVGSPSARMFFLDNYSGHPRTSSVCGLNLLIFTLKIKKYLLIHLKIAIRNLPQVARIYERISFFF